MLFIWKRLSLNNKLLFNTFSTKKSAYQILGIKQNSGEQQIKRAYRNLVQKYHPDKNADKEAKQIFIEIKNAYQILIDEDKRRQHDNQIYMGSDRSGYGFAKDPFDEFKDDIYKDKSRVYHQTYSTGSTRRKKGEDILKQININFIQSVKGVSKVIQFQRKDTCKTCNGNRCASGTTPTRCLACGGSGSTIFRKSSIVMHLQCTRCDGIGLVIKHPCVDCNAVGIKFTHVAETIEIPSGVSNGQRITFYQKGNHSQNGPRGDLLIKINVEKHKKYRKIQNNIQAIQWITVSQAVLGVKKKQIDTIWGKSYIRIDEGTQDGTKIKLKNEGIKIGNEQGDHISIIRILIPKNLNNKQKQIYLQLSKQQKQQIEIPEQQHQQQQKKNQNNSTFQRFKDIFK